MRCTVKMDGRSTYSQGLVFLGFIALTGSALSTPTMRGIPPQDTEYFESETIMCKDGSKSFPRSRLNDNYCDCTDGTDEPGGVQAQKGARAKLHVFTEDVAFGQQPNQGLGTSACPRGKFYCINAGHTPLLLFSSRVNDGICDCCDGSDEYYGKIKCPNACGKVEKPNEKFIAYKEAFTIAKQDTKHAKQIIMKEEAELELSKQDQKKLEDILQKIKDLRVFILLEMILAISVLLWWQGYCRHRRIRSRLRRFSLL